ncbi:MAG: RhuM family protein [Planctomycetia bacterium]|nr:RhuM family protein [Planctomycetia bacterium]
MQNNETNNTANNENNDQTQPSGELLVYQGKGTDSPIQVRLEGDSVWLSQKLMAQLYGTTVANINQHISSIYEDEEIRPEATIKKYLIVQTEGSRQIKRLVDFYNLQMIIAVGFRVRSHRGTQFRQWANDKINEYLVKGFVLDDDRLKGKAGVTDYFDELLARIRDIRASEARVYLMIREIFALAADYRDGKKETLLFFATMQICVQ